MNTIYQTLLYLHILAGASALILFWLPVYFKKGSRQHNQSGRAYVYVMYVAAGVGTMMSLLGLCYPEALAGRVLSAAELLQLQATRLFLLYLSLLTVTTVRHATLVLQAKQQRTQLRQVSHLMLMAALFIAGPCLAYYGWTLNRVLLIIFGSLGALLACSFLYYSFKATLSAKEWVIEHLSSMIGSGIACYTAFFAFGGRALFAHVASLQLMSWILPSVIGAISIKLLKRRYSKQFAR
ncbi:hypothetical protein [Pseudoalteromonas xiamenensis]|uniref:DUF2306 domain-containing protein n=1 Tax=Pseudoalteromonas xiamenensis TaxID=882626 RepID=A0A975HLM6_9GAMM|nr:hypothetical protein [Pseudoalteromonas xiamenensis]QTH72251.1 hypothetical protein J5O05_05080 [Pseudoalteromonas xiamenensis]